MNARSLDSALQNPPLRLACFALVCLLIPGGLLLLAIALRGNLRNPLVRAAPIDRTFTAPPRPPLWSSANGCAPRP